jgi:hypothetical protein
VTRCDPKPARGPPACPWFKRARLLELGLRLPAAEVGERPRGVAQHRHLGAVAQLRQQRRQRGGAQHQVAAARRVAGNVAQSPDGLLADVIVGGTQQRDEDGDSAGVDHDLGVVRGARGDIRQRPRGLKLQLRDLAALQELNEARDHALRDHLLNRRVALCGEV